MNVYGKNSAREVLKSNLKIEKVTLSNGYDDEEILMLLKKKNINYTFMDKNKLDKLVNGNSQGILLKIKDNFYVDINEVYENKNAKFIVVLDHIEDVHNFGAIIRTSGCAGVDYIIIPNKGNAVINETVMKTSSGALVNSKIAVVANLRNTINKLKENNYWIIGTDANGTDYRKIDYSGKVVLVIGSEGKGMKEIIKSSCDFIASLPLKGKVNSLNASVAAGIMIYEVVRYNSEIQ